MKKECSVLIAAAFGVFALAVGCGCWLKLEGGIHKGSSAKVRSEQPFEMLAYTPPADWVKYMVGDDFYISVPPTVELRKSDDVYTQEVKDIDWQGYKINTSAPVFQQKGLAVQDSAAFRTYCRIMLDIQRGEPGDFLKSYEYTDLTEEEIRTFQEGAEFSSAGFKVITTPTVHWVKLENLYGIMVEYTREGSDSHYTRVSQYYFFNDDKVAHVILSHRLDDAYKWAVDFNNVVKTFKWKI